MIADFNGLLACCAVPPPALSPPPPSLPFPFSRAGSFTVMTFLHATCLAFEV